MLYTVSKNGGSRVFQTVRHSDNLAGGDVVLYRVEKERNQVKTEAEDLRGQIDQLTKAKVSPPRRSVQLCVCFFLFFLNFYLVLIRFRFCLGISAYVGTNKCLISNKNAVSNITLVR